MTEEPDLQDVHESEWADRFDPWDPEGVADATPGSGAVASTGAVATTGIIEHEVTDEVDDDDVAGDPEAAFVASGYDHDGGYFEHEDDVAGSAGWRARVPGWARMTAAVVIGVVALGVVALILFAGSPGGVDTAQEPTTLAGEDIAPAAEEPAPVRPLEGVGIDEAIADGSILGNSSIDNPASSPDKVMHAVLVAVPANDADLLSSVLAEDANLADVGSIVAAMQGDSTAAYAQARQAISCNTPEGAGLADCTYTAGVSTGGPVLIEEGDQGWRLKGYGSAPADTSGN